MKWLQTFINVKLNQLTAEDLRRYSIPFELHLTKQESEELARVMRQGTIDFFNETERAILFTKVERIIGTVRAKKLNTIFQTFVEDKKL
ncbi:DUF2624 family protein [Jeotgalibacillus soli]|uniref:Uncharacterized protein n=1 Tax=Jeotgalibacillus soli TaxID=889306 RepID=A0A0C2RRP5_9BACL|nr:DUF2624 family protein [Jeotgalibacillus soli]KIL44424.1 hypothetical protein KP78_33880 [Jeotgalibacillus soli]